MSQVVIPLINGVKNGQKKPPIGIRTELMDSLKNFKKSERQQIKKQSRKNQLLIHQSSIFGSLYYESKEQLDYAEANFIEGLEGYILSKYIGKLSRVMMIKLNNLAIKAQQQSVNVEKDRHTSFQASQMHTVLSKDNTLLEIKYHIQLNNDCYPQLFYGLFFTISSISISSKRLKQQELQQLKKQLYLLFNENEVFIEAEVQNFLNFASSRKLPKNQDVSDGSDQFSFFGFLSSAVNVAKQVVKEYVKPVLKVIVPVVQELIKDQSETLADAKLWQQKEEGSEFDLPEWQVGIIKLKIAVDGKIDDENGYIQFNGTLIDKVTIITSKTSLIEKLSKIPISKSVSISGTIEMSHQEFQRQLDIFRLNQLLKKYLEEVKHYRVQIEDKRQEIGKQKTKKAMINGSDNSHKRQQQTDNELQIAAELQDTHEVLYLFLEKPFENIKKQRFQIKFIQDKAFYYHLINSKIHMSGWNKQDKLFIMRHQQSGVNQFNMHYLMDNFKRTPTLNGSPIYYIDEATKRYIIFAINNSTKSKHKTFVRDSRTSEKKEIVLRYFSIFLKKNQIKKISNISKIYEASIMHSNLQKKAKLLSNSSSLTSLLNEVKGISTEFPSTINCIGILKVVCEDVTLYSVGVKINDDTFLTTKEHLSYLKQPKIITIYFKNKRACFKNPLYFNLRKTKQFNMYQSTGYTSDDNFLAIFLNTSSSTISRPNEQYNLQNIAVNDIKCLNDNVQGFVLSIKSTSSFHKDQVLLDITYLQELNKILRKTTQQKITGPMFIYEKTSSIQQDYFFGFYYKQPAKQKAKQNELTKIMPFQQHINWKLQKDQDGLQNSSLDESMFLEIANRTIISQQDIRFNPYSNITMIVNKYAKFGGSGAFIKSKSSKKPMYILTCAHNFYSKKHNINYAQNTAGLSYYQFRFHLSRPYSSNQTIKIPIKKVHIHEQYIKNFNRPKISPFYDIAVIELEKQMDVQGFNIRQQQKELTFEERKSIEIAGFPLKDINSTIGGVMYTEKLRDKPKQYGKQYLDTEACQDFPDLKRIRHRISTLGGNSGSPIFYQDKNSNQYNIIGVHNKGGEKDNYGVYLFTPQIWKFISKFIDPSQQYKK